MGSSGVLSTTLADSSVSIGLGALSSEGIRAGGGVSLTGLTGAIGGSGADLGSGVMVVLIGTGSTTALAATGGAG